MVGVLGALRMLPEVVGHFLHGERPAKPVSMRLRDLPEIPMAEGGWVLLGERPGEEIALGLVGKFWRPVIEFAPIESAEEFRSFDKAGFAKTVYDLSASELEPGRTLLTGLMRTATTDERPPLVPPLLDLRRRLGPPHPRRGTARLRAARRRRRRGGEAMRSRRFWAVWNRTVNPVVRLVLRSPLHGLLSRRTALITGSAAGAAGSSPSRSATSSAATVCPSWSARPSTSAGGETSPTPVLACACGCGAGSDPATRSRAATSAPGSPSRSLLITRGLSEEIPDEFLAGWASADRGGVSLTPARSSALELNARPISRICGVCPAVARSTRSLMPSSIRRSIRKWGSSTKSEQ